MSSFEEEAKRLFGPLSDEEMAFFRRKMALELFNQGIAPQWRVGWNSYLRRVLECVDAPLLKPFIFPAQREDS